MLSANWKTHGIGLSAESKQKILEAAVCATNEREKKIENIARGLYLWCTGRRFKDDWDTVTVTPEERKYYLNLANVAYDAYHGLVMFRHERVKIEEGGE